jgi:outer membrane receptor protein involved in Fe transport
MSILRKMRLAGALVGVFALFIMAGVAAAQSSEGVLVGAVTDQTGAVIPNVNVKAVSPSYGQVHEATTDSAGTYRIEDLQPGVYSVTFTAPGLAALRVGSIAVTGGVTTTVNGLMQLGSIQTTVTVEAGAGQIIDTQSGQLGASLDTRAIESLPYGSFNAAELSMTLPGVTDIPQGQGNSPVNTLVTNGISFSVNGSRPRGNSFLIDGQDDNDYSIAGQAYQVTNLGLVQDFTILTNSYSAQYGRAGGAVGNYITKSGSNSFHGQAWEVNNDSFFGANDAQNTQVTGNPRPLFIENTFGFDIGGPVIKDKLFFFGTAQWDRTRERADGAQLLIPDANGITTLKSLLPNPQVQLFLDSLGGLVAPGSHVCGAGPNSVDEQPGGTYPCITMSLFARSGVPIVGNDRDWNTRLDWHMGANDSLTGSYIRDDSALSPDFFNEAGALPPFDTEQGGPSQIFRGQWTHIGSTRVVNELRFSYTNIDFSFAQTAATLAGPLANIPLLQFASSPLPNLGVDTAIPDARAHKTTQVQEALTYSLGRHTILGGADITFVNVKDEIPFNSRGSILYETGGGFDAFGNFLDDFTGQSGSISKQFGNPVITPNVTIYAPYIQDTWRIKDNFTLSLGLRYEYWGTIGNSLEFPAIDHTLGFGVPGAVFPNMYAFPQRPDRNNFAPRLGVAYTPRWGKFLFGDQKTVIRAGYGVFYDGLFTNIVDNTAASTPNATGGTITGGAGRGQANALEQLGAVTPLLNPFDVVSTMNNNLRNPVTQQFNLNVQRELPWKMVLSTSYVGTRGTHLFANQDLNPTVNYGDRINPNMGEIEVRSNAAQSWYNAGQVELQRSLGTDVTLRASYTYSHFLDDSSEVFNLNGTTSFSQILDCQKCDWGNSLYDRRHRFVLSYVWSMPYAHDNKILKALTDQWQWSGIATLESGTPNNVVDGFDNIGNGHAGSRPNIGNPKQPISATGIDGSQLGLSGPGVFFPLSTCFFGNPGPCAAEPASDFRFIIPAGGPGDVPRNSVYGPGQVYFDTSIQRRFPIPMGKLEDQSIMFRVEFFNALNHPNTFTPSYNLIDPLYNQSSTTITGARVIKFWLKYEF